MKKPVSTVDEFCEDHCISRAFFYNLVRQGLGPRILKLGNRTLITAEAGAEWRQTMERRTEESKEA